VAAVNQAGGFSPGLAARLRLADGRRYFVKAVGVERNPVSPELFRREASYAPGLPAAAPVSRLLWSYDDGEWVALVFADVPGRTPAEPWRRDELTRVLAALEPLWDAMTPTTVPAPTVADKYREDFAGWRGLAAAAHVADGLSDVDPWAVTALDRLAACERGWAEVAVGETLMHGDLRADNILLTDDDGVVFVDWPNAVVGPRWADLVFMLPSVAMHGHDPEAILTAQPAAALADPSAVTAVLAAVAGFFVSMSLRPAPPGLPLVRAFQRAQGRAALRWLRQRLDGDVN
jgi:aminoglycoside phosphotransferase (APT) family kinase protein